MHITGYGSTGNLITANDIGTNDAGDTVVPNGVDGVLINDSAASNIVGVQDNQGRGNVISGNAGNGVHISGAGTEQNMVGGNSIGVEPDDATQLANGQSGVLIDSGATANTIGSNLNNTNDAAEGNTIVFNTLDGVTLVGIGTVSNAIHMNSIFDNIRLGINLGGAANILPNTGEGAGPNNSQDYPVVTGITMNAAGNSVIAGQLSSAPNSSFYIKFYGNNTNDTNWGTQGHTYLGSIANVMTNAQGLATFNITIAGQVSNITATATDSVGNTSEEFGIQANLAIDDNGPITPAPENTTHDVDVAANGNVDSLGTLPMGQGHSDHPGDAYTNATENIATLTGSTSSATSFRWKRLIVRRSWTIHYDPVQMQWDVTQRSSRGTVQLADDTGPAKYYTTALSAMNKLYAFDDSALVLTNDEQTAANGDYVYEEKQFSYELDVQIGGIWYDISNMQEGQILDAKRTGNGGAVANDWSGIENSFSARTLTVQITQDKVRGIVGGAAPISIDPNANN